MQGRIAQRGQRGQSRQRGQRGQRGQRQRQRLRLREIEEERERDRDRETERRIERGVWVRQEQERGREVECKASRGGMVRSAFCPGIYCLESHVASGENLGHPSLGSALHDGWHRHQHQQDLRGCHLAMRSRPRRVVRALVQLAAHLCDQDEG